MAERNVEDVEKVIRHAKLDPEHLHPVSQNLYFGNSLLDQSDVRLMEVPAHLSDLLSEGETLVIRGDGDDSAVICSSTMTFDLKEAETSNGFLLLEGLKFPAKDDSDSGGDTRHLQSLQVCGIFHRYLELRECKPRLSKLRTILAENMYSGPKNVEIDGPTMSQLLDRVQCSQKQLDQGLLDLQAVCVPPGKHWYMLDPDYHMRVLSHLCNFVAENSWSYDSVNKIETVEALKDLEPDYIVEQIFDIYFFNKSANDDSNKYSVRRDKLCRFFGEYLLQTGTTFDLSEFMSMWSQSMPEAEQDAEGFQPEIGFLRGLALINTETTPQTVRSFPESSLPEGVHDRLQLLFRVKEKWTVDEIAPYVESLTTPILNVNGLMTKFARAANVNGKKVFCSKHGK